MTGYKTISAAASAILLGLAVAFGGPVDQELLDLLEIDVNTVIGGVSVLAGAVFGVLRLFTSTPAFKKRD